MADTNNMEHSSGSWGENLAMSSQADVMLTTGEAVDMWYNEFTDPGYDFNNPGWSHDTGHFTQVVWVGTTEIGCGVKDGWVCCRYTPPGNYQG